MFLDKSESLKAAAIFPDIKTLASEKTSIQEEEYGSDDDEYLMKILASGDRLADYDVNDHLFYPKYLKDLIKNHNLSLVEQKVYVSDFFGNLYKSENDYYILVDEVNLNILAESISPDKKYKYYEYQFDKGGLGYSRIFWSVIKNEKNLTDLKEGLIPSGYKIVGWENKNDLILKKWKPYYESNTNYILNQKSEFNGIKIKIIE